MAGLAFWKLLGSHAGGADLAFVGPQTPQLPVADLAVSGELEGIDGNVFAAPPLEVAVSGTLAGLSGSVTAAYDNAAWRWTGAITGSRAQVGTPAGTTAGAAHQDSLRQPTEAATHYQTADLQRGDIRTRHQLLEPLPVRSAARHQTGLPLHAGTSSSWVDLQRTPRPVVRTRHQTGIPLHAGTSSSWIQLIPSPRPTIGARHQPGERLGIVLRAPAGQGLPFNLDQRSAHQVGITVWGWGGPLPTPPAVIPPEPWEHCWGPHLGVVEIRFDRIPPLLPGDLSFACARSASSIPIQRTYLMLHDLYVIRLSDDAPVPTRDFRLTLDVDSWAWTFSATLLGPDAVDLLQPPGSDPVILEVGVDGHIWHILVEDWTENRVFGSRSIQVTGRSLSALLAAPYELPRSYAETAARTAHQLADQELPFEWSLTWGLTDWLVPAGAWTYQNLTPIQAIARVAEAPGAVIVPAKADKSLTIQPRYPSAPWEYAAATPILTVPEQALTSLSSRLAQETGANAVYVHGAEVGGVLARIYRSGTAGDRAAQTVMDTLITHTDAARQRGKRILSAQHQPPEVRSVTLPLDDGTGFPLAEIGDLVEIGLSTPVRGIVAGVQVQVQRDQGLKVRQTLTLGEDAPNAWSRFSRLLPTDPLLVGEILANHGDGTATVQPPAGGTMRVRGTGTVGQNVYVRGGRIEGAAPALPAYDLSV